MRSVAGLLRRWSSTSAAEAQTPKTVFTGFQPSGGGSGLHLGNYLGAIQPFLSLQDDDSYEKRFLAIVDMHALTSMMGPEQQRVRSNAEEMFATAHACGVDLKRTTMYLQSDVGAHAELFWLLNCRTPIHLLNTMTQWKEKRKKANDLSNAGLYTYPVLMAADILLFGATHVPVGEDQLQHLELTRKLADIFNTGRSSPLFVRPKVVLSDEETGLRRVMDLRDPTTKMSKSSASEMSRINLSDSADDIAKKIKKAKTDEYGGITWEPDRRPELANLLRIYGSLVGARPDSIAEQLATSDFGQFKTRLTEVLVETVVPIGKKTRVLLEGDRVELRQLIAEGAQLANQIAQPRLRHYKAEIFGGP